MSKKERPQQDPYLEGILAKLPKPGPWANECDCDEEPMCAKHKAASALLEALEVAEKCIAGLPHSWGVDIAELPRIRAAIRAARGPEDRDDDNLSTRRAAKGD